jgi:dGTP triphosphohydrolase
MQTGQRRVIRGLFNPYIEAAETGRFELLPEAYVERVRDAPTPAVRVRVIGDLVASLRGSGAASIFERMEGLPGGSSLDLVGRVV